MRTVAHVVIWLVYVACCALASASVWTSTELDLSKRLAATALLGIAGILGGAAVAALMALWEDES